MRNTIIAIIIVLCMLYLFLMRSKFNEREGDSGEVNKGISSSIESFFDASEKQKEKISEIKSRQEQMKQKVEELQKDRLQAY